MGGSGWVGVDVGELVLSVVFSRKEYGHLCATKHRILEMIHRCGIVNIVARPLHRQIGTL